MGHPSHRPAGRRQPRRYLPDLLASGVLILGMAGKRLDLLHLLFGSALAVDAPTLTGMLWVCGVSLITLLLIYRPLVLDTLDPLFLQIVSRLGPLVHGVFLTLVVLNLVIGFQAIGALMVVGLMMLPPPLRASGAVDCRY
jgi:zinc/manganese transport system permease protein